jgi:hypothetical protein
MAPLRLSAFLLFVAFLAASQNSNQRASKSPVAEPKLPVIEFDACGSPNPSINPSQPMPYKLEANDRLYSSWRDNRTFVRGLAKGTEVTQVGAVNIIREPDRGVITGPVDESLRPLVPGDEVLGYGLHSDGFITFWGKGVSFTEYYENLAFRGSCGFADKSECHINILKRGVQEWWLQLKTSDGVTGWILGLKQNGDKELIGPNAGYACRD